MIIESNTVATMVSTSVNPPVTRPRRGPAESLCFGAESEGYMDAVTGVWTWFFLS
jgi:hypothetical protein